MSVFDPLGALPFAASPVIQPKSLIVGREVVLYEPFELEDLEADEDDLLVLLELLLLVLLETLLLFVVDDPAVETL